MSLDGEGIPPLAFVQLLNTDALEPAAVASFRSIMAREGTSESLLVQHNLQAPLRWFRQVYPDLDVASATLLGLTLAQQAQLTSFGPLSLPLVSAGSVAEVVQLLAYLPLISTALSPVIHPADEGLTVGLSSHTNDKALDCFVVAYGGSIVLKLIDVLAGAMPSVTLHMNWPAPDFTSGVISELPAERLVFSAPTSFLSIPADALNEVCRFADPVAYRLAIADLERTFNHRNDRASYSERVRRVLEEDPEVGSGLLVARSLNVSRSTLKRRLREEGTTFRDLRESILREHAMLRILDRSMSISQIAGDLGYSDLTNFSHAFKRWTGQSPSDFRNGQGSWVGSEEHVEESPR